MLTSGARKLKCPRNLKPRTATGFEGANHLPTDSRNSRWPVIQGAGCGTALRNLIGGFGDARRRDERRVRFYYPVREDVIVLTYFAGNAAPGEPAG